ncbi:DUF6585 family protein [Egbenema bharatensis]|uniref:DUF6585 family protein n=1 Tax=Egbenema bharatensis TaxID=3463334 RepID=UPI003A88C559
MDIEAIAQQHHLGQLVSTHSWHKRSNRNLLILVILFFPFVLIGSVMFLGIPLFISLYLLIRQIRRLTTSKQVIYLFEHGLIDHRHRQPTVIRYSDVDTLQFAIEQLRASYREEYSIKTQQGKTWQVFHTVDGIRTIGDVLQQKVLEAQLPRAIAQLRQGELIKFQKVQLSHQGIHRGRRFLSWSEVEQIGIQTVQLRKGQRTSYFSRLCIWKKDQSRLWDYFLRNRFPNLALFLTLANVAQKGQVPTDLLKDHLPDYPVPTELPPIDSHSAL